MKADNQMYANLKNAVIDALGENNDLEKLKDHFRAAINSPRTCRQIKTVSDLIVVLEQRDVLNYQCPMALFYIGKVLNNEHVQYIVKVYRENYLPNHPAKCKFCGKKCGCQPTHILLESGGNRFKTSSPNTDGNYPGIQSGGNSFKTSSPNTDDLMDAIRILSGRLKNWRVLASELKIKECIIDEIYERHPKDKKMQAYEALKYWIKREKENATIEHLDKALNARLCKRIGMGSYLRKPLASLDG